MHLADIHRVGSGSPIPPTPPTPPTLSPSPKPVGLLNQAERGSDGGRAVRWRRGALDSHSLALTEEPGRCWKLSPPHCTDFSLHCIEPATPQSFSPNRSGAFKTCGAAGPRRSQQLAPAEPAHLQLPALRLPIALSVFAILSPALTLPSAACKARLPQPGRRTACRSAVTRRPRGSAQPPACASCVLRQPALPCTLPKALGRIIIPT